MHRKQVQSCFLWWTKIGDPFMVKWDSQENLYLYSLISSWWRLTESHLTLNLALANNTINPLPDFTRGSKSGYFFLLKCNLCLLASFAVFWNADGSYFSSAHQRHVAEQLATANQKRCQFFNDLDASLGMYGLVYG